MTNITTKGRHSFFQNVEDRPEGSIKTVGEIRDNISEDLFIYSVQQSGYITKKKILDVMSVMQIIYQTPGLGPSAAFMACMVISEKYGDRFEHFYLEQDGISLTDEPMKQCGAFQAFFKLEDAQAYSDYLKGNDAYLDGVKAHHDYCNEMFEEIDRWYDE